MKNFFSSPGRIIACIVCAAVILILAGGLGAYAALSLTGAIAPKGNEVVLAETSAAEEKPLLRKLKAIFGKKKALFRRQEPTPPKQKALLQMNQLPPRFLWKKPEPSH